MSARSLRAAGGAAALIAALSGCAVTHRLPTIVQRPVAVPASDFQDALAEARSMYLRGEYGLAIGGFRNAIRLSPDDATGYDGLAACYDRLGRFDLSRRYYEVALAFAPTDARIYRNLALSLRMQGREEEARVVLADAAALPVMGGASSARATATAALSPDGEQQVETAPAPSVAIALDPAAPIAMPDWIGGLFRQLAKAEPVAPPPAELAQTQGPAMLILNANGRPGLAASTRARLHGTKWQAARLANAPARETSEIVYPSRQPALARLVQARMPFPVRLRASPSATWITLWLGADATADAHREQRG